MPAKNYPERPYNLRPNLGLSSDFRSDHPSPTLTLTLRIDLILLLLHIDKDHRTTPSVSTAVLVLAENTEGKTAFLFHRSSHTATGCPVEKQNKSWFGSRDIPCWKTDSVHTGASRSQWGWSYFKDKCMCEATQLVGRRRSTHRWPWGCGIKKQCSVCIKSLRREFYEERVWKPQRQSFVFATGEEVAK